MSKLCTIVGCGPAMGSAIAQVFAKEGFDLALLARSRTTTEPIALRLGTTTSVTLIEGDVTDRESLTRAFSEIRERAGETSVLVYNVATMVKTPPSEVTAEEIVETLPAMLFGAIWSTQEVLSTMRARGSGTLLYTGGGFGIVPAPFTASHSIGKAALRNWVFNLHEELAPEGIHAATVTITRPVGDGGVYDRATIARHYLALHRQPAGRWDREVIHKEL